MIEDTTPPTLPPEHMMGMPPSEETAPALMVALTPADVNAIVCLVAISKMVEPQIMILLGLEKNTKKAMALHDIINTMMERTTPWAEWAGIPPYPK